MPSSSLAEGRSVHAEPETGLAEDRCGVVPSTTLERSQESNGLFKASITPYKIGEAVKSPVGWSSLGKWAVVSGLLTFAVVSAPSIGLYVLPLAVTVVIVAARKHHSRPASPWGAPMGAGIVLLLIGILHLGDDPCPPNGVRTVLQRGDNFTCGGFDPTPWLLAGLLLIASGCTGFLVWRRRRLSTGGTT